MCNHEFVQTSHSRICTECGVETRIFFLDTYNPYSAPICKGYERAVRFKQKINKLIFLFNAPQTNSPVWEFLKKRKLQGPSDIRRVLRMYKGKNKYYDSIRLLTRVFTAYRIQMLYDGIELRRLLTTKFNSILRAWKLYNLIKPLAFFSYDFLLRLFLFELKSPLIAYCKPITCRKRHIRNHERLKIILAATDDEMCCRNFVTDHSQSD